MTVRRGSHWAGPILGSSAAGGGVLEDTPIGVVDRVRGPYKTFVETFDYPIASAATFAGAGCTLTDIDTATSPTVSVTSANGYLLINPGTKADSGSELQWNAVVSQATYITPATRLLGPITSTATLMDSRELFWFSRIGISSDTTAWDGKVIMGWITTDTSLMTNTTGVPSVVTGGGIGFHIGEDGVLGYFASQTAITAAPSNVTGVDVTTLDAAATLQWYTLGFRCRWIDASAGTGVCKFYLNGRKLATEITTDLPMQSTEGYGVTYGIHNGPSRTSDLAVDYIVTGISRAGLTFPYTSGTY